MQNEYQFAPPVEGVAGGGTGYGWNDANLQNMGGPILRVIDPTRQPTSDLVHVWCMPSTATIQHQEQPRPLDQISMLAARNERESVQLALRPKVSWASGGAAGYVKVDCTDMCSCSGERLEVGKAVTIRRVVPMLGIPDALVPLDLPGAKVSLLPGETSALWISVHVPVSQPPGVYEGEISILAMQADADSVKYVKETEKDNLREELQNLLSITGAGKEGSLQTFREALEAVGAGLKQLIGSPFFSTSQLENEKMEIDGEAGNNLKVTVKLCLTVWDFVLPVTPSLPAVIGISETVIEDRFGVEHGSEGWYEALDVHFFWLLQYRISPYFCRWGGNMRVLAYTCPWPVNHPKADEYFSDERLAAYAVPYYPVLESSAASKEAVKRELEILRAKPHWKKSYFYLWDEPVRLEQYETIRGMSSDIKETAPDARVLTTYYCGPCDSTFEHGSFEALVKVPSFLRPHTQIFCTSEWALGNSEALVKDILAEIKHENNEEWWTYVCLGPTDPHPNFHLGMRGTQQRAVMWRVWKEGGTGFLYWGANCYEKAIAPSAEIRFRRGLPPGDGVLFYPGEVFTPGNSTPVASVRLERLLSGLQDFEYLQLYSSQYGRHAALSLLERTGVYLGPDQYTHDHGHIDAFRAEVFSSYQPQ